MPEDRYPVSLSWSEPDAAWIAEAPDLPGCTTHGATRTEAAFHIRDAITAWLDTARELGRDIPTPTLRSDA